MLDAAECPPTFDVSPDLVQGIIAGGEAALAKATEASEDDPEKRRAGSVRRGVLGRGCPGRNRGQRPDALRPGAMQAAREMGALTIGISCTPDSELSRMVEIAIEPLAGPEVIAGSTR